MKNLALLDVGGTTIKYGLWDGAAQQLTKQGAVATPKSLNAYYDVLTQIVAEFKASDQVVGVAMSTPGAVNKATGIIEGASALPYIHHFEIQDELETRFDLPVVMENDANCAALAEVGSGAAKGLKNVLFMVIGTGVGGSVIVNGQVQHGRHLFGGEFGYMMMNDGRILSEVGTAVHMADRYNQEAHTNYSGREVFELADQGDLLAQKEAQVLYDNLAQAIYNLQYSFDPEAIILGGGVSQADFLVPNIEKALQKILKQVDIAPFMPTIRTCQYHNDANLIGAMEDFRRTYPNLVAN
ncbi:ROK family protein [Latilactobacillus curvatus]|uniref:ROK family protein n=1 Tax=Latilactobacillus curvatus TaxID=28038 RepID=A0A1X7QJ77_LATCU|nr:ROK family protein [Latilactobacillus curvatus]AXN36709.1 ROK family protein [Latilactobacillus curvatus]MCT1216363.1 ROK family protein [Latilactobacillus curvatus]MCT3532872.1 ROK family protein [Latilactobacillus curvatus]MCW8780715.1 ROK family protein [Latilactobacillus curvatus]UTB71451.1 N-acetylmannosamine kinase [Latilactobacillus curvatus]